MLQKLKDNQCGFLLVEQAFDWSKPADQWLSLADICRAAGFEPTPGDCISVSCYLRKRGLRKAVYRGKMGARMPPLVTHLQSED